MGLFDGIKKAKRSQRSQWDKPGHYIQRIDRIKEGKTREPANRPFLVLEKTIIKSFEGAEHKAGTATSHMLMKDWDSFLGDVIDIVCSLTLCDEEDVDTDATEALIGEDQPLAGWICEVKIHERDRSDKGKDPFTVVNYVRPVPARELLQILDEDDLKRFFPDDLELDELTEMQEDYL